MLYQSFALRFRLGWLFEASTAIYPSAYITLVTKNPRNFIYGQNTEALRVHKKFSKLEVPVISYTRYQKGDEIKDFYSQVRILRKLFFIVSFVYIILGGINVLWQHSGCLPSLSLYKVNLG